MYDILNFLLRSFEALIIFVTLLMLWGGLIVLTLVVFYDRHMRQRKR